MNVIKIMGRNGIDANMPGDWMTLPCAYWQGNQGITVLSFFRMHHFRRSTQTRNHNRAVLLNQNGQALCASGLTGEK
jgi:hypothetical protein